MWLWAVPRHAKTVPIVRIAGSTTAGSTPPTTCAEAANACNSHAAHAPCHRSCEGNSRRRDRAAETDESGAEAERPGRVCLLLYQFPPIYKVLVDERRPPRTERRSDDGEALHAGLRRTRCARLRSKHYSTCTFTRARRRCSQPCSEPIGEERRRFGMTRAAAHLLKQERHDLWRHRGRRLKGAVQRRLDLCG